MSMWHNVMTWAENFNIYELTVGGLLFHLMYTDLLILIVVIKTLKIFVIAILVKNMCNFSEKYDNFEKYSLLLAAKCNSQV